MILTAGIMLTLTPSVPKCLSLENRVSLTDTLPGRQTKRDRVVPLIMALLNICVSISEEEYLSPTSNSAVWKHVHVPLVKKSLEYHLPLVNMHACTIWSVHISARARGSRFWVPPRSQVPPCDCDDASRVGTGDLGSILGSIRPILHLNHVQVECDVPDPIELISVWPHQSKL
jgi:hypothetical protein